MITKLQKAPKFITDIATPLTSIPTGGTPSRDVCRAIATADESKAGVDLIERYRAQEAVKAQNDIPGISHQLKMLEMHSASQHVGQARLRKQIAAMDPDAYEAAEIELERLQEKAVELVGPVLKRLVNECHRQLIESVVAEETRLRDVGIGFDSETLRANPLIAALLSRRNITAIRLEALDRGNSIGAVQQFLIDETEIPFEWLPAGFSFATKFAFASNCRVFVGPEGVQ